MRILIAIAAAAFLSACGSAEQTSLQNEIDPQQNQAPAGAESMEFTPPNEGKLSDEHMKMYISVKIKERMLKQSQSMAVDSAEDVNVTEDVPQRTESDVVDQAVEQPEPVAGEESKGIEAKVATEAANVETDKGEAPAAAESSIQTTAEINAPEKELDIEKLAINEFGYDVKLYHWISQTVTDAMTRNSIKSQALQSIEKQDVQEPSGNTMEVASVPEDVQMHNDAMVMKYAQELAFAHEENLTDGAPNSASTAENIAKQPAEPAVTQPAGS